MAGNVRHWALSKLDSSSNLLDNVMVHLLEIAETYKEYHPEIATPCEEFAQALTVVQTAIQTLRGNI